MTRRRYELTQRMCIVCGHVLAPYLRICDKCGSIQRSIRGDGVPIPPDEFLICARCGKSYPKEDKIIIEEEWICAECSGREQPLVIESPLNRRKRRIKKAAVISGSISIAAAAASVVAMIVIGGAAFTIILALSGLVILVSAGTYVKVVRGPKEKIEIYKPIKPKQED